MAEVRRAVRPDGTIDDAVIEAAAARLRAGGVVAFPTETVYGLGASTCDADAIAQVYAHKGRPSDNPLIAHVADGGPSALAGLVAGADPRRDVLAERFWPGPLTLVVARDASIPPTASGGRDTIAVRCPRHPVALALLRAFGGPVSAPSANVSGHVSPTTSDHVASEFAGADVLVLDGGPCAVGLESTVLDLTVDPPRVLRPGSVTADELRAVIGEVDERPVHGQGASPGTRTRHYAPRARAVVIDSASVASTLAGSDGPWVLVGRGDDLPAEAIDSEHRVIALPDDAAGFGRALYAAVRDADATAADRDGSILLVMPADDAVDGQWRAVRDRLQRMVAD